MVFKPLDRGSAEHGCAEGSRVRIRYLTRPLKDHTLLQAIACVNRLCEGKDFGYIIDCRGVLSNLQEAFEFYRGLKEAAPQKWEAALTNAAGIRND
ncbi:hypothetical protein Pla52o_14050 [Novipirellula galeiformis]|uniref:Uncharacterized protein n=1 Tax=Novipirellula galeiformis TaxID=2528004 RepID=A0A5C6CNB7_9BACT|nr:hypothetical protein Pla52o_14050 [Novipirellula galeiformis]